MTGAAATATGPLKTIRCPCGFEVRSTSDDELVAMARLHVQTSHGEQISEEQARALIQLI